MDQCEDQANLFDQRSSTRSAEITAISKAIEKLESGAQPNYDANEKLVELQKPQRAKAVKADSKRRPRAEKAKTSQPTPKHQKAQAAKPRAALSFLQRGSASEGAQVPLNK